jgi:mannose-6-phosphate isomerase-like protein (cupin superfamily)
MSRSEEFAPDGVSRYRDALLRGASSEELAQLARSLEPGITDVMHLLRSVGQAPLPLPRPDFATRLERELLQACAAARPMTPVLEQDAGRSPNGHAGIVFAAIPPRAISNHRQFRSWLPLAAVALLAVALSAGLLWRFVVGRMPESTIQASGEPRFDMLVDATVTGAADSYTPITVDRWEFQPGSATLIVPALNGPQWIVVERARVEASVDGVSRALDAGQSLVIPAGQELQLRHAGPEEASVLRGVAASGFALEQFDRGAITKQIALDSLAHEALPPGRSRISFERITLPPGATLLAEPATGQDWIGIDSGTLGLTLMGDGVPVGWSSGHERELVPGDPLPALAPGTHVSLHNIGDAPLVLLRLYVTPLDGDGRSTGSTESQP